MSALYGTAPPNWGSVIRRTIPNPHGSSVALKDVFRAPTIHVTSGDAVERFGLWCPAGYINPVRKTCYTGCERLLPLSSDLSIVCCSDLYVDIVTCPICSRLKPYFLSHDVCKSSVSQGPYPVCLSTIAAQRVKTAAPSRRSYARSANLLLAPARLSAHKHVPGLPSPGILHDTAIPSSRRPVCSKAGMRAHHYFCRNTAVFWNHTIHLEVVDGRRCRAFDIR